MGLKQQDRVRGLQASEDAAVWLQRLRVEDTPQVRAEFSAWVREGARNLEEFLFAQAMWKEMDQIDPQMRERLRSSKSPDSVVDFPGAPPAAFPLSRARSRARPGRRGFLGTGSRIAAAFLLCALVSGVWWAAGRNTYVTAVGEQISVKLPDGSMMHLNTDSRAVVNFSAHGRAIRLESGEALFTVERDSQRPFDVLTPGASIRALGTEFNVRETGGQTRVAVIDGAVQISSNSGSTPSPKPSSHPSPANARGEEIQLRAGDEASVDRKHIVKVQKPNIGRAVSWRGRRLMFPGDPVGEIAAEFNRYSKTTIRIEGPELQTRRMSGVFDADDPSPLVRFLERDPGVEVIKGEDEILIRAR